MTDAGADREADLSARQFEVSEGQRAFRTAGRLTPQKRRGRLSKAQASERRGEVPAPGTLEVVAETVEVAPPAPSDPDAALRHARIGVVTAAVLVLMLVWIMQRKRGTR